MVYCFGSGWRLRCEENFPFAFIGWNPLANLDWDELYD